MAKRDLREATIRVRDATPGVPLVTEILMDQGNITWNEQRPLEYTPEKGSIANGTVRKADEVPVEVSFTGRWTDALSVSADGESFTMYELLKRVGAAANAVSTGADSCEPYAVELEIVFAPTCAGATTKDPEVIVFNEFREEGVQFDAQAGTISVTGKSKEVSPTYSRSTATAAPVNTVPPVVAGDGTPVVGEEIELTSVGTWTGGGQPTAVQWFRADDGAGLNEVAIDGAIFTTYTLAAGDSGKYLSAKVTYTNAVGSTTAQSNRMQEET